MRETVNPHTQQLGGIWLKKGGCLRAVAKEAQAGSTACDTLILLAESGTASAREKMTELMKMGVSDA